MRQRQERVKESSETASLESKKSCQEAGYGSKSRQVKSNAFGNTGEYKSNCQLDNVFAGYREDGSSNALTYSVSNAIICMFKVI